MPLEGQKALFITVLSVAEETLMETLEEVRCKPSVAPLKASWLFVCEGPIAPQKQELPEPLDRLTPFSEELVSKSCQKTSRETADFL